MSEAAGGGGDSGDGGAGNAGDGGAGDVGGRVVRVRRSGGFAGMVREGEADADAEPELGELVGRIDVVALGELSGRPTTHADRYTYDFDLCGRRAHVPEQHLTDDLRRVVELVLGA